MVIGFTGSRIGMTTYQWRAVKELLKIQPNINSVHHGDCIGADFIFDKLAKELGLIRVAHPCDLEDQRAHCDCNIILPPKKPLTRNKDIARVSDLLIACPKEYEEVQRSGTWATIRAARKLGRKVEIVWPDFAPVYAARSRAN
jgi:hypothetical protein